MQLRPAGLSQMNLGSKYFSGAPLRLLHSCLASVYHLTIAVLRLAVSIFAMLTCS